MSAPVLVTGATGQVGGELVRLLLASGLPVRALARDEGGAERIGAEHPDADAVVADLRDAPAVRRAATGAGSAFLMSPVAADLADLQIGALEALGKAGVGHVVKLSTMRADLESPLLFERAHGEVERHLRVNGPPATLLRPNAFMQNLLRQAHEISRDGVLRAPAGRGRVGFVDARDVAAVAATALAEPEAHGGGVHELTGPRAITHVEIAAALSGALGREVRYEAQAPDDAQRAWEEAGVSGWRLDDAVGLYEGFREERWSAVTGAVEEATGRPPRTLEAFLRDHRTAFGPQAVGQEAPPGPTRKG